ncbi:SDR family NAD(P)-dependent oxidoreductase [Specibacter sp. RAF43]|uniref:SDR family NAD(P)-dependent oxidoreductase n=1 Tax=Specibacter sp. RAF43 TaxID=3233057 RepID=UPI003F95AC57
MNLPSSPAPPGGVVAVILAGGVGTRVGLSTPKQLVPVAGRTSLEHTMAVFDAAPGIDSIIVMMEPHHLEAARRLLAPAGFRKLAAILPGGATRNDTTRLALAAIERDDAKVLFHDAVRPLVDQRIIQDCLDALDSYDAVDTAIASADTIIEVNAQNCITGVPRRSTLRRGQTPQAFRRGVLARAYERAATDPAFEATDDCSVVLNYLPEVPIVVVEGSDANIKITQPVDIHLADKLFQLREFSAHGVGQSLAGLAGQTVVIFGAASGIGLDLANSLTAAGATVHGFSRGTTGTDIQAREDVRRALAQAHASSGRIDHVVLSAGVLHTGALVEMSDADLAASIGTNLTGAAVVAQESHAYLRDSHGSLLLYTSSSYTRGRANYSIYSATKAAIVNLTQALSDEWAPERIRVNCINPARTSTPMRTEAFGVEDPATLLNSEFVAHASAQVLASTDSGHVFDLRLPENDPLPTFDGALP